MDVIGFRIEIQGSGKAKEQGKQIASALKDAGDELKRFGKLAKSEVGEAIKQVDKFERQLIKLNKTLSKLKIKIVGQKDQREIDKLKAQIDKLNSTIGQTEKESESATQQLRRLTREAKDGAGRADKEYNELIQTVGRLKAEQAEVTKQIRNQQRAFENNRSAAGSYDDLNFELGKLRRQFRELGPEAREAVGGQDLLRRIGLLDGQLKELDDTMGINVRNVGNYKSAIVALKDEFAKFSVAGLAVLAAQKTLEGLGDAVQANIELSDSIADVRKTTNLGRGDLEGYNDIILEITDTLRNNESRTSLVDQLDITRIAGQLGVGKTAIDGFKNATNDLDKAANLENAKRELLSFTEAIDTVVIALGDELPGGAEEIALVFGRLASVLGTEAAEGDIGSAILKIASSVNALSAGTKATSGEIIDFSERLGGIALQANISEPALFAIGATLAETGQRMETSATAISTLLVSIGSDVEGFAKIAGVSTQEFSDLLQSEDGGLKALQLLAESARSSTGGLEGLAETLDALGIDGARSAQVIGALSGSTERLAEIQALASAEFEKATSVQDEAATKADTLAGSWDELSRQTEAFTGETFTDFLKTGVDGLTFFIRALRQLPGFISENRDVLGLLLVALVSLNFNLLRATAQTLAYAAAEKAAAIARGAATAAQWLLNIAMSANPIGIVIAALAALTAGFLWLSRNFPKIAKQVTGLWERFIQFRNGTGLVNRIVRVLTISLVAVVNVIKGIVFAVQNWQQVWAGTVAAIKASISNIVNQFKIMINNLKIVGKNIQAAFASGERAKQLDAEIAELRKRNKDMREAGKNLGEEFSKAFAEKDQEVAAQNAEEAKKRAEEIREEERKARLKKEKEVDDESAEARKQREEQELADRKRRLEQAEKDRIAAIKKIRDLEAAAIADETDRGVVQATNTASDEIAGLAGTQDQIARQSELIRQKLSEEIVAIFATSRTTIIRESQSQFDQVLQTGGLLPTPDAIEAAAEGAIASLEARTSELFERQRQAIRDNAVLTEKERAAALAMVNQAEIDAQVEVEKAKDAILAKSLRSRLESIEQEFEAEANLRRQRAGQEIQEIRDDLANNRITREEAARKIKEIEERLRADEEQAEVDALARKAGIVEEGSADFVALKAAEADALLALTKKRVDDEIEEERRSVEERRQLLSAALDTANQFRSDVEKLVLVGQENRQAQVDEQREMEDQQSERERERIQERIDAGQLEQSALDDFEDKQRQRERRREAEDDQARKKAGRIMKAFAVAEIAINLARELSEESKNAAANPLNALTFGAAGATQFSVKSAIAIARAGLATAAILAQKFEYGGEVASGDGDGNAVGGSFVGADGRLHGGGHGSPAQTTIGPDMASIDAALSSPAISDGLPGYRPEGSVFVVGRGYVPNDGGLIQGPRHTSGGVKAITSHGRLVEFEGGEFALRNGNQLYIINRQSTRMFRPALERMNAGGNTGFSMERRQMASAINAIGGGLKFQDGGDVFAGFNQFGANAIRVSQPIAPQQPINTGNDNEKILAAILRQNETIGMTIEGLDKRTQAINQRIDRIRVVSDPQEIVELGLDQIRETENDGGL